MDFIDHHLGRTLPQGEGIDVHGGQGRAQVTGDIHVVESDHDPCRRGRRCPGSRGRPAARPPCCRSRRRPPSAAAPFHQLDTRAETGRLAEVPRDDHRLGRIQAGVDQRLVESPQPFAGVDVAPGSGDHRDPAMAQFQQVTDRLPGAGKVVDRDRAVPGGVRRGIEQHQGDRLPDPGHRLGRVIFRGHHQQAVDAAEHRARRGQDLFGVGMGARQHHLVGFAAGHAVDAADHLGVELPEQVGQQHSEGVGAVGGEALGGAVGPVVEPGGDLHHPVGGVFADQGAVVEHPGNRGDRNS